MFVEHECFILDKKIPNEDDIQAGETGVVLIVYDTGVYEVEFVNDKGCNIGSKPTFTLAEDYMAKLPAQ
jgi:hypothetical protein